jgi:hypothetical protein
MSDITIGDVTNATTGDDGTGSFDVLMKTIQLHLDEQHQLDRITGSDYATVYLGAMQSAMQQAIQFALTQEEAGFKGDIASAGVDTAVAQTAKEYAQIALIDQQQISELAQTTDPTGGLLKSKFDLIAAQTLGFQSDTKQKILKQMLEGYAVTLSLAGVATAPSTVHESAIDQLSQEILTDNGSSVDIQSSVQVPEVGV